MRPYPRGKRVFAHVARSDGEHSEHAGGIAGGEFMAVEHQEQLGGDEGGALVAIDERMIARQPPAICGGQRGGVGLAVGGQVLRPRQRRFKQPRIARA